ncbi:MAG: hypothetical protein J5I98_30755 [Phaeodactylibacter sp.]|nr:hypothetical protein [Phaeodactylibacter sp.]
MKTLSSCLLLASLALTAAHAQNYEYWAETTQLDSFEVIENGKSRMIRPHRADKTQFLFSCGDPGRAGIRMHCEPCEVKLTLKLYGAEEGGYTDWIELGHGQKISVQECFEKHPAKTGLRAVLATGAEMLRDFWNSFGNGRSARDRAPALKSGRPEPGDPKLEFLKTDYHYYLAPESFSIRFRNLDNYPVKSIYIIRHDGELSFHAGNRDILGDIFDLPGTASPSIASVLKIVQRKETETTFELNWEQVKSHLFHKFEAGEVFQLGVELEGDTSDYNPYLFNFQFFSPEEVKEMEQFFNRA